MTAHDDSVSLVPNQGWDNRVLVCRCGTTVDSFIVVTTRYVVLVDTLISPQTAAALLEFARELLGSSRQLLVVNTHADWDHCWGNQLFAGPATTHPAPIIASRRCGERLHGSEAQQVLDEMRAAEPVRFGEVQITPPTVLFEETLLIDGGDLTLELFPTPGHQPDHIAIFIREIGMLLAGDAAESPFPLIDNGAGVPLLRDSLARMAAREPAAALYCHAPVTSGPNLLRENMAYFDTLERRCREALARGIPPQPDQDADLETLIDYPFAAVTGVERVGQSDFYRTGHRSAIRAMLEHLHDRTTGAGGST